MSNKEDKQSICIRGARVHNLKNIDVDIPHDKLVVITGLSGSGKSTLAFDTIFAEGQRRYVESLSAYARQFLGRIDKPDVDSITGIAPAIAVEQKVNTRNPRSTVGTSTEIYDYLKLLFARIGRTFSPISGREVKANNAADVSNYIYSFPDGERVGITAPLVLQHGQGIVEGLSLLVKEGFQRVYVSGKVELIDEILPTISGATDPQDILVVVDRLTVSSEDEEQHSRLLDSANRAFSLGGGVCGVMAFSKKGDTLREFSSRFEADGIVFEEPTEHLFGFNNPIGACPRCEGYGKIVGIDEDLVIPDKTKTIYDDAVAAWRGDTMKWWKEQLIANASKFGFPIHKPYYELTKQQRNLLWTGNEYFHGLDEFFKMLEKERYKIQYRVMLSRYTGKTTCPDCGGSRLRKEALYVKVGGLNIAEMVSMTVGELLRFFVGLQLDDHDTKTGERILVEIRNRLGYLTEVGLSYLTLDRLSSTLSGGESQRINLATSLGSNLTGSLYILDEPSIGLHARDTGLLINVLRELQALGNTVVVVEHDEEIIRAADYIIDIGPDAGRLGGQVVYQGDLAHLQKQSNSYTVRYLTGEERIELPPFRRPWNNYIAVKGARGNNLKKIDVKFPLNVMTVVTGVSGSGKSTLVRDIFYAGLKQRLEGAPLARINCNAIEGDTMLVKAVDFVDQNSIGKSTRSNPVTYIGAYDEIRRLFADQALSKQMGYDAAFFSFNKEGGRCEECKGEGTITVEMQFMADITLECEACHGKRFRPETLEVEYRGKNIYDVLDMTVNQAIEFFGSDKSTLPKKITRLIQPLQDVGLGYIKLGQTSSTLSGGENQRVKLASYLGEERREATLFIFDEPTTGLHFHDIKTLLKAFNALIEKGHTIVIIEHNLEIIKCADYLIDLGPEGGAAGGHLVCAGTPEEVAACPASYTGRFLQEKLAL
ncbi:MAG: excinuclease ABC subunit UvrA [Tannerella sp.]|jgi:excinuclease ABC subunit A|nr:excinuclease ABC subunit UvrA [Tannerella sp.]